MMMNKIDLQEERRKLMKNVLDLYDPNNEGFVKSKDIAKILRAMGRILEDDDEQNFVQAADPENTGEISKDNFLETVEAMFSLPKEEVNDLLESFKVFDINNTGKISVKNFKKVLVNIGQEFNEDEADDILKYIEVDREGNINIKDFINMWKFQ
jgi:Ca2+-binding EF-hand superfamily protein